MLSEVRLPHSALNTYHSHVGLLYQFILSEFIVSLREIKHLAPCITTLRHLDRKTDDETQKQNLIQIARSVALLVGSSQEYMRLFSWNFGEGSLAKLKNYCAFFLEKDEKEDHRLSALHRCANRAWILCLHSLDLLRSSREFDDDNQPLDQELLCRSLEKVSHHMRRIARLLTEIAFEFRRDENVIFFFLRHRKDFDELIGPHFVAQLIKRMFPQGFSSATTFVTERYLARGFHEVVPIVVQAIHQLEKGDKEK